MNEDSDASQRTRQEHRGVVVNFSLQSSGSSHRRANRRPENPAKPVESTICDFSAIDSRKTLGEHLFLLAICGSILFVRDG